MGDPVNTVREENRSVLKHQKWLNKDVKESFGHRHNTHTGDPQEVTWDYGCKYYKVFLLLLLLGNTTTAGSERGVYVEGYLQLQTNLEAKRT